MEGDSGRGELMVSAVIEKSSPNSCKQTRSSSAIGRQESVSENSIRCAWCRLHSPTQDKRSLRWAVKQQCREELCRKEFRPIKECSLILAVRIFFEGLRTFCLAIALESKTGKRCRLDCPGFFGKKVGQVVPLDINVRWDPLKSVASPPPGQPIGVTVHCTQYPIREQSLSSQPSQKTLKILHPDEAPKPRLPDSIDHPIAVMPPSRMQNTTLVMPLIEVFGEQKKVDVFGEPGFSSLNGFECGSTIRDQNEADVSRAVLTARSLYVKSDAILPAETPSFKVELSGHVKETRSFTIAV
ncbi:uncharacterized protein TNCV_16421 [Trichonephila clavipes]|nr:uncharacterized protein TNCV_16421 [Trichonephila clavipes]